MYLIILLYALLAGSFIVAKKAICYADPFFLIGFRMIVAGSILLLYRRFKNSTFDIKTVALENSSLSWLDMLKVTIFHIYLSFVLEFWALQYVSASKVILLYSLTPFIAGILSYFLCNEVLSFQQIIGIGIGFLATIDINQIYFDGVSVPELVLLTAIISGAYAWFIIQKLLQQGHSITSINGTSMLYCGILSLITWHIWHGIHNSIVAPVNDWYQFILLTTILIILSNVIIYNLYGYLVKRYSITLITFIGFLCPVFGTFFDALLYDSIIRIKDFVSILLLIMGLYLFCNNKMPFKVGFKKINKFKKEKSL